MSSDKWYRYRLASTEAGLETAANFFARGLPKPELAIYNDHSARRSQNQGGIARLGYNTASLLWARLTSRQAKIIEDLVATAEASSGQGNATLYLTLPKTLAEEDSWIDISGIAPMPEWSEFVDPQSNGRSYVNVRWTWNNCTLINEPSTVN